MEELTAEARKLLDENPPRMGWAYHPDMNKDVLVERGTGCVIDWTNGEYTPRPPQIHHVRERKINGTIYREDGGFFEGFVQYMYLDCEGEVTVGIGHLIKNAEAAKRLPFYMPDEPGGKTEKATPEDKEKAFNEVLGSMIICEPHTVFKDMTELRLSIDTIETLFENDVDGFIHQLTHHYPEFDTYPKMAQLGMLDLIYNMGYGGFIGTDEEPEFEDFNNALKYRNWIEVAEQSHRSLRNSQGKIMPGLVDRNAVIRGWFLQASEEDPFFVKPKCPKKNMKNISWIPDFT